jgi:hypothetical protein
MAILFDVVVNIVLAFGIGLAMGFGWGVLSFIISIWIMLTIAEKLQDADAGGVFFFSLIKDAASLGATIVLSEVTSMAIASLSKLQKHNGGHAIQEGGQLKEIGKAINDEALGNAGNVIEKQGNHLVESAQSLEQFNDFYGLSPMAIALISYVIAKALYVLYLSFKK